MPSATPDTWNNPQIPPPPPSPAMVGARYRDTSPSADPDYEARYPEAPVNRAETNSPVDMEPSPISRQPSTGKSRHRSDSISKNPQKKKRARVPSAGREGGDEAPRPSRSQQQPGYNTMPLNYYPPPPPPPPLQYQGSLDAYNGNSHSHANTGGYPGPGYYNSGYGGGMNNAYPPPPPPPPPPSHVYPPPLRMDYESPYYGNAYTPAHLPPPPQRSPRRMSNGQDEFAFMEPGFEHQKQPKNTSQAGPSREYHENGAVNGVQNGRISPANSIKRIEETKEGEEGESGKELEGEESTVKAKDDILDEKQIPMPYPSPPQSPIHSSPQHRPTGYPLLAKTLSTTPSLQLYRRFSTLNHLVLLHLQDEISELETVLSDLDDEEYLMNGGARLRARRGMGTDSRRLQVMGAIAFKLQQYNKALKGYTDMNEALEPAGEEDLKRYKEWMETSRPLVKAEGMVLIGHPEDLACLHRRVDTADTEGILNSWKKGARKNFGRLDTEAAETPFSPAFKLGMTMLSCSIAGLARWRVSQATGLEMPLALAAGATGGVAAMMWAFF